MGIDPSRRRRAQDHPGARLAVWVSSGAHSGTVEALAERQHVTEVFPDAATATARLGLPVVSPPEVVTKIVTQTMPNPSPPPSDGSEIGAGAIAGIIIGVVVVVGAIGCLVSKANAKKTPSTTVSASQVNVQHAQA